MFAAAGLAVALLQGGIPEGSAKIEVDLGGLKLDVFTHKPSTYKGDRMIMVFHGVNRNADEYRDHSIGMGERFGALIVAPLFDAQRFPTRKYQFGGILDAERKAAPPEQWTYALIPQLAMAIKQREAMPQMKHWIIGHSAGGQFVARMAAFQDTGAERLVAANPSSWPFPTRVMDYGYGFGNLPEELSNDSILRKFLAQRLTVYLGTADNTPDANTDMSDAALVQGPARLQRGRAFFEFGKTIAQRRGWEFQWTLVEADGVGHDHGKMFDHPACEKALFGDVGS